MLQHKLNLAIVEDHPLIIEGLKKMLDSQSNIIITGVFTNCADFMSFIEKNEVDIVLLDITLPDVSGIDLCKEIKSLYPTTNVLAISNHNDRSIIMKMLENGASGYLLKSTDVNELMASISKVMEGKVALGVEVQDIIFQTDYTLKKNIRLTKREEEILKLIASGKTTPEIADQLFVSKLTIETHRRNLLSKFEVKNMAEMIKVAAQEKYL